MPERTLSGGRWNGNTVSLQCGCWFPDRWSALALAGPAIDDRDDLPVGEENFPPWEHAARQAHRSSLLSANLNGVPVLVDFPWWFDGLEGTHPEHHRRLVTLLTRSCCRNSPVMPPRLDAGMAQDPSELAEWFLSKSPRSAEGGRSHMAYSTRSFAGSVRVEQLAQPGKPSVVKSTRIQDSLTIQTRGVAELAGTCFSDVENLRLDRQKFAARLLESAADLHGWVHFQQWGEKWPTS